MSQEKEIPIPPPMPQRAESGDSTGPTVEVVAPGADIKMPPPAPRKKVAAKKAAAKKAAAKKASLYRAKRFSMHHPYQNVTIPVTGGVLLEPDNWVEVQLQAGVIEEA